MDTPKKYFQKLKAENVRLTKSREALIEVLDNQHLTFKEIQKALVKKGFYNVSTLYNNLEFLIKHKIILEFYINGTKYYDLAMDNPMHSADSHIHIVIKDTNEITEVNSPEIFEFIQNHPFFKEYDLEHIKISISAQKKKIK